tara:strand:- start:14 stop:283 length:270 start_codon:yes stop_codon:yes gene_type:complete
MGKKKSRTSQTSKGTRRSSIPTSGFNVYEGDTMLNKLKALKKGKDVTFTLENPNKEETNRRFVKYKISGKSYQKSMNGAIARVGKKDAE